MFFIILRCSSSEMGDFELFYLQNKKKTFGIWYYFGNRKTKQMRTNRGYLFSFYSMGISYHHLQFGRHSKAGRGVWKLIVEKEKGFRLPWLEAVGMGRWVDAQNRVILCWAHIWLFLVVLSCKWGQQLGSC